MNNQTLKNNKRQIRNPDVNNLRNTTRKIKEKSSFRSNNVKYQQGQNSSKYERRPK